MRVCGYVPPNMRVRELVRGWKMYCLANPLFCDDKVDMVSKATLKWVWLEDLE